MPLILLILAVVFAVISYGLYMFLQYQSTSQFEVIDSVAFEKNIDMTLDDMLATGIIREHVVVNPVIPFICRLSSYVTFCLFVWLVIELVKLSL